MFIEKRYLFPSVYIRDLLCVRKKVTLENTYKSIGHTRSLTLACVPNHALTGVIVK